MSTYTFNSTTATYANLTGATTVNGLTVGVNGISNEIMIPFTFTYGGENYTKVKVSSNGYLTFGSGGNQSVNSLANAMIAKPLIMPLWDDALKTRTALLPQYTTTGTGTNRIFKVEWRAQQWGTSVADAISFQVWLYETTNVIEFVYKQGSAMAGTRGATIGLYDLHSTMSTLNGSGATPTAIVCHGNFKTDISDRPATNQLYRFTPTNLSLTDRWWVHVYDNGLQNVSDIDNMNSYVGYYSFKTSDYAFGEGFKTNNGNNAGYHGWTPSQSPTEKTSGYIGCQTTAKPNSTDGLKDRFKYHFRRSGLPCGFYRITMEMLDDKSKMLINGDSTWVGSLFYNSNAANPGGVACSGGCNQQIGYLYLDENSTIELRVQENTGFTGAWMGIEKLNATYATDIIDNNNQPLCLGNSVVTMTGSTPSITAVGLTGSLLNPQDVPWEYKWEKSLDGISNWTVIAGEEAASLSPGITNASMHYRRKTVLCGADAGTSSFAQIIYPGTGNEFGQNGNQKTCVVNTNDWVHFFHNPGGGAQPRLLASIHSGGQNLGNVTVTSYVGATPDVPACLALNNPLYFTSVLDRHWVITPQFQPSSSVKVRLPFKNTELSTLVTKSGQNLSALDNVATIADLKLSKYSGPNNVDASARNNCADQGGSQNTQSNFSSPANGNTATYSSNPTINVPAGKYKDFTIPGFSEFWLHGQSNNSALPVELLHFSALCKPAGEVIVQWSTASESNSLKFKIEKSRDLQSWFHVGEQAAAGNSSYEIDYEITDLDPAGLTYYRLIQVDQNGNEEIYGPVSNLCGQKANEMIVFPNPVNDQFTVEISSEENTDAILEITDISGKIISRKMVNILKGKSQLFFDSLNLAQGSYFLKLNAADIQFRTIQFIVNP